MCDEMPRWGRQVSLPVLAVSGLAGVAANNTHYSEQPSPAQSVGLWGTPGHPIILPQHRRRQPSSTWMEKDRNAKIYNLGRQSNLPASTQYGTHLEM